MNSYCACSRNQAKGVDFKGIDTDEAQETRNFTESF